MSGYSTGLVEYLLRHRAELQTGAGLPKRAWQLVTRVSRSRFGGAPWEHTATLRCDLERGLGWLDPISKDLLLAAHTSGHPTARLYNQRLSARNAGLRATVNDILDRLTTAMNGGLEDMPTKPGANGTQTAAELAKAEQPAIDLHDVIDKKLAKLPGVQWRSVTVSRTSDGRLDCRVTV